MEKELWSDNGFYNLQCFKVEYLRNFVGFYMEAESIGDKGYNIRTTDGSRSYWL
jgi:hypothetical protein